MTAHAFRNLFAQTNVMVILRGYALDEAVSLARRAWSLGLSVVEIPVQFEADYDVLAAVVEAGRPAGHFVGAGTVVSVDQARRASDCGAAFTVAPGLDAEVARTSIELGLPHLPGVATASDVQHARRLGLDWQKAFPAAQLGASWISAMHGPFPDVRFVATGGIDTENAATFLKAGSAAVALGSSFAHASDEALSELGRA